MRTSHHQKKANKAARLVLWGVLAALVAACTQSGGREVGVSVVSVTPVSNPAATTGSNLVPTPAMTVPPPSPSPTLTMMATALSLPANTPTLSSSPNTKVAPTPNTDSAYDLLTLMSLRGNMAAFYTGGVLDLPSGSNTMFEVWKVDLTSREASRLYSNREARFQIWDLALSPDRAMVAFTAMVLSSPIGSTHTTHSSVRVMRSDGSELRTLVETSEYSKHMRNPQWSPDGSRLAYVDVHDAPPGAPGSVSLHIYSLNSESDQVIAPVGGEGFGWSPDSGQLAIVHLATPQGLSLLDPVSRQQRILFQDGSVRWIGEVSWQPGGAQIVVTLRKSAEQGQDRSSLYLVDSATGQQRELVDGGISAVHWSPDGKKLVYLVGSGQAVRPWLFDLASGASALLLDREARFGTSPWSRNGDALLLSVKDTVDLPYWVSILTLSDRRLIKLVQTEWLTSPVW